MRRHPVIRKETGNDKKPGCDSFTDSLTHKTHIEWWWYVDDNDYILMTLREMFWASRLLTSESNSNEDHPWIIQYFYRIFNA